MAVIERRREQTENGIVITRDELREYEELKQKRDRSELSMRTRMFEVIRRENGFARKVVQLLDANKGLKSALACEVYELANEILAEE